METFGFVVMAVFCWFISHSLSAAAGVVLEDERPDGVKTFWACNALSFLFHLGSVAAVVVIVTVNR